MKEEIRKIISKAIGGDAPEFSVDVSDDKSHGDYSTNVALILAKKVGKNPREVAEEIKGKIKSNIFSKIEIAGPGFINFFISDKVFIKNLKSVDKNYGRGTELRNKKVIVEYTDPNPFKEFHIGHLTNNAIGESLSRLFEFQGAKVKRANYYGDVGMHVAKAIWGVLDMRESRGKSFKADLIKDWAAGYKYGSQMYEDDGAAKKAIIELNKKIYERSDEGINKLYDEGKKVSLDLFSRMYEKLGTKFDYYFPESGVAGFGKKIVEQGLEKDIFEKGENGAIIFRGEKFGLHTRVFINSEGLPTYEAKELGLAKIKYKKYAYDISIVVTGNEVNEYFRVLLFAMSEIFPELAKKTKHIGHGMLRVPEGKMSSRTGGIITAEFLIQKIEELVKVKIKDKELGDSERENIAEKVAIGALKYSRLKQANASDIIFDFDKSISFEGDSGPYLQYSYTRAESVLRKAKVEKIKPSFKKPPKEITGLERAIYHFPEIILQASENYEPHFLVLYLTELAGVFNRYYAKNKIVDKGDEFSPYRVALTGAFATVMKNGMKLLAISPLEKM